MKKSLAKLVLSLLIVLACHQLHAQAYKDSIQQQFLRYTLHLMNKEFAQSVDYINPDFFKIVPKAQMIKLIEQVYNSPEIEFVMDSPKIASIEDKVSINNTYYTKLKYSNNLFIKYSELTTAAKDTALMMQMLQQQFGRDQVSYDPATLFYKIGVTKNVVANSKDNQHWTFVVIEEKQKPILEKFLPKQLL